MSTSTHELAEHYFRQEYAKMVSVITRYFGLSGINLAEDIVQDTLLEALHQWEYKGLPPNPSAWLYTVAKNKALNVLKKNQKQITKETLEVFELPVEQLFAEAQIADDQLRMMFACCHPSISEEAQICLILKTLCGMSISEISKAFLTSNETINKRLVRARKRLKEEQVSFGFPAPKELDDRLTTVMKTILLLFNEGYNASAGDEVIRFELCLEAIRLTQMLCDHSRFKAYSSPNALMALMLFNTARFKARIDEQGQIIRMVHQDRKLWDQRLIMQGIQHLEKLEESEELGLYHVLATISAYHCTAPDYASTNWQGILNMYDLLLKLDNSPLVKLNRSIAVGQVYGAAQAIDALLGMSEEMPSNYYLYYSTLADLYFEMGNYQKAIQQLEMALPLTTQASERHLLEQRMVAAHKKLK